MVEGGQVLGGKGHDFSFRLRFEVTVIHLRRIVRQAVVFIDLELNRKYGLEIYTCELSVLRWR